eukprot:1763252-Alexandrium_andersonii.AAC.1
MSPRQPFATLLCSAGAAAGARGFTSSMGTSGQWEADARTTGHFKRTLMPMCGVGMPICFLHAQASHLGVADWLARLI